MWMNLLYALCIVAIGGGLLGFLIWLLSRTQTRAANAAMSRALRAGTTRRNVMHAPTPPPAAGHSRGSGFNFYGDGEDGTGGFEEWSYGDPEPTSNQPPAVDPRYRREETRQAPILIDYGGGQQPVMPAGVGAVHVDILSEAAAAAHAGAKKPAAPKK